ncbi:MAG: glycosyltransferase family protein, partial [Planctomycetota bacterium]
MLFCSPLALQRPFMRVAEILARRHDLEGHFLAPEQFSVSTVQHPAGRLAREDFAASTTPLRAHFLPARRGDLARFGFQWRGLKALLRAVDPDFVWIHAEFWEGVARQVLWHYRLAQRPRIVAYVAVNDVEKPRPLASARPPFVSRTRLHQLALWSRLDGVAACATKSLWSARRMGLPDSVPGVANYLPVLGPEDAADRAIPLPWAGEDVFMIGFAGALTEQKGWKVLL